VPPSHLAVGLSKLTFPCVLCRFEGLTGQKDNSVGAGSACQTALCSLGLRLNQGLGEPSRKFHVLPHIAINITLFFIFDRDQAVEILAM
jgi:hypothetical protein